MRGPHAKFRSGRAAAHSPTDRAALAKSLGLPAGSADDEYLAVLSEHLPKVFEAARPQLVFYQAGVDPHEADRFGRLNLTSSGLKKRNKMVFDAAVGADARLVLTMGGGYPRDLDVASAPFSAVMQSHMDCYRACVAAQAGLWRRRGRSKI